MTTVSGVTPGSLQRTQLDEQPKGDDFGLPEVQDGSGDMQYYLQLMAEMQAEARAFTTFSNILTTRHQASMNAIRNTRAT